MLFTAVHTAQIVLLAGPPVMVISTLHACSSLRAGALLMSPLAALEALFEVQVIVV